MFLYIVITRIIQCVYKVDIKIFDLIFLLVAALVLYIFKQSSKKRVRYKIEKNQMIMIVIMIYYILYFSIGLIFGYQRTIYDHSLSGVLNNILYIVFPAILIEYIRYKLICEFDKKTHSFVFIIILITLFEINFLAIVALGASRESLFKYFTSSIFPIFLKNIFLCYVGYIGNFTSLVAYVVPISLFNIIVPIIPSSDWFTSMLYQSVLIFILYIVLRNIEKRTDDVSRRFYKRWNMIYNVVFGILFFITVFFVAGFFKYQPVAIVSDSMKDAFERGDAVIINKISDKKKIGLGDIIAYRKNRSIIVHRVVSIDVDYNGDAIYHSKGDNNDNIDNWDIFEDEVIGVVKFKLPSVGYPTVWINDYFNKK